MAGCTEKSLLHESVTAGLCCPGRVPQADRRPVSGCSSVACRRPYRPGRRRQRPGPARQRQPRRRRRGASATPAAVFRTGCPAGDLGTGQTVACGPARRPQPGPRKHPALPDPGPVGGGVGVPDQGHLAAHECVVLPPRGCLRLAGRRRGRGTGAPAGLLPARRGHRRGRRPGPGAALPDRVHPCPGPRDGLLAVPAQPQAGPPRLPAAVGAGRGSPSWKSSSTLTSGTPTASPPSRSGPSGAACRAGTMPWSTAVGSWPRWSASP